MVYKYGGSGILPRPKVSQGELIRAADPFPGLNRNAAIETFLETGPTIASAQKLGVNINVFRKWLASPEGRLALEQARTNLNSLLDIGFTTVIESCIRRVKCALEEGNSHVGKDGEIIHTQMTGKDAATILAIAFDRRQLLRKQPTSITDQDEQLSQLATKLRELGTSSAPDNGPHLLELEKDLGDNQP